MVSNFNADNPDIYEGIVDSSTVDLLNAFDITIKRDLNEFMKNIMIEADSPINFFISDIDNITAVDFTMIPVGIRQIARYAEENTYFNNNIVDILNTSYNKLAPLYMNNIYKYED